MPMQEKTKKNKYSAWIRRIVLVVLGILLGFSVYFANARTLAGNKLPMPFGLGVAVVLSGSMEPTLSVDDVIFVRRAESYDKGDIVVYDSGRELVVHRIIEKNGDKFVTQGDANTTADDPINASAIMGKVVSSVPNAGFIVNIIRSPIVVILIVVAAILLIECSFRRKKDSDNSRIEQIKEEIRKLKDEENQSDKED